MTRNPMTTTEFDDLINDLAERVQKGLAEREIPISDDDICYIADDLTTRLDWILTEGLE